MRVHAAVAAIVLFSGAAVAQVSTFDSDLQGWGTLNDARSLSWRGTIGNPPGSISVIDQGTGVVRCFSAPAAYLGDRSAMYGGLLGWDILGITGNQTTLPGRADVMLVGGGLQIGINAAVQPASGQWTSWAVTLDGSADWRLITSLGSGTLSGTAATPEQIQAVLGDLTGLSIRGEYTNAAGESTALDNVSLIPGPGTLPLLAGAALLGRPRGGAGRGVMARWTRWGWGRTMGRPRPGGPQGSAIDDVVASVADAGEGGRAVSAAASNGAARRRPNLLVLGASGQVAQAFLRRLGGRRDAFGELLLLDRNERVTTNRFLEHKRLRYTFLRRRLRFPEDAGEYVGLLRSRGVDIVLDLTDLDTPPVFEATDSAGVSYMNTALNQAEAGVAEMVDAIHPHRQRPRRAPHIISSGMNPGAVNIWVTHGVRHYGRPLEIVHFEYDTSTPASGWRPIITWSRQEFLTEVVWEPTGVVENGEVRILPANAVQTREDLGPVMRPVIPLKEYPRGYVVLHEENVKLGRALGASSRYIYAIHPRTMDYIDRLWRRQGTVRIGDLEIGDNTTVPLVGTDTIGVMLRYPDRRIYYINSKSNADMVGTNATCAQVAVGVYAGLITLLTERLRPRVYFASELYDTVYRDVLFSNMRVEHFVCGQRRGRWVVSEHQPELHPRPRGGREQQVV